MGLMSTRWKTLALIAAAPLVLTLAAYSQELEATLAEVLDQTLQVKSTW